MPEGELGLATRLTWVGREGLHASALQLLIQCLGNHDIIQLGCAVHLHVAACLVSSPAWQQNHWMR